MTCFLHLTNGVQPMTAQALKDSTVWLLKLKKTAVYSMPIRLLEASDFPNHQRFKNGEGL